MRRSTGGGKEGDIASSFAMRGGGSEDDETNERSKSLTSAEARGGVVDEAGDGSAVDDGEEGVVLRG